MNKTQYADYLQSNHWKELRRKKLEASGYRCEKCGSAFALQVHHIRYRRIYDVTVEDLVTVCNYCHEKEHGITSGARPIKPNINHLLRGVFHIPQKQIKPTKTPRGHTQEQIREIIKQNKLAHLEIPRLVKQKGIWAKALRREE